MKKFFLFLIITLPPMTLFAEGKPDAPKAVLAYKIKDLSIKLDGKLTEQFGNVSPLKILFSRTLKRELPQQKKQKFGLHMTRTIFT